MTTRFTYTALPMALAIAASFAHPAFADDTLDTIVVTASRTEQKLQDTLSSTSVITRDDIERLQPVDFTDLLRREAGVDVTRTGGRGTTTSLLLRGTASNQTVFLVDGVRINTTSNGAATLELIDLEQIERVEIVRGPASSLYGNDAIGGVIQIFTRKGADEPHTTLKTGYGTDATQRSSINHGGRVGNAHYNINTSYEETNGINATNKDNFGYDEDDDGFHNAGLALSAGYDFEQGHEVAFNFNRNEGESEFDRGEMDFDTQVASGKAGLQLLDNLKTTLTLSQFEDQQDTPDFESVFDTRRDVALWQTDYNTSENNVVTAGVEYVHESLDTNQGYTDDERHNRALFLQDQLRLDKHAFQLGIRHDDNDQYGIEKTWNTSYGYDITDTVTAFGTYGTAFKAPTFNDLYFPYMDYCSDWGFVCASTGNPALEAETSRSFEVGLKSHTDNYHWSASAYKTNIRNLISWAAFIGPNPWDSTYMPINIDDAVIHGLDLAGGITIDEWRFNATATFLNPQDSYTGDRLIRRSKRTLSFDVDRSLTDTVAVGLSLNAQSGRVDGEDLEGNRYLSGYSTVNLRSSYQMTPDLKWSLAVNNIFDVDYQVAYGYEMQGVNAMLTAEYKF